MSIEVTDFENQFQEVKIAFFTNVSFGNVIAKVCLLIVTSVQTFEILCFQKYAGCCLLGLNPFPNKHWFLRVCSRSLLKTLWEKEKLLVMSNFSFFPQCFLPIWRTFCCFYKFRNCRLEILSIWESLKFVVWERVNI